MAPITVMKKPKDTRGTLRRLLRYLTAFRPILATVIVLSFLSNVLALLGPSLAGSAIRAAAAGKGKVDFSLVRYYAERMLLVYAVSSLLTIAINFVMVRSEERRVGKECRL